MTFLQTASVDLLKFDLVSLEYQSHTILQLRAKNRPYPTRRGIYARMTLPPAPTHDDKIKLTVDHVHMERHISRQLIDNMYTHAAYWKNVTRKAKEAFRNHRADRIEQIQTVVTLESETLPALSALRESSVHAKTVYEAFFREGSKNIDGLETLMHPQIFDLAREAAREAYTQAHIAYEILAYPPGNIGIGDDPFEEA